jgi:hypothetical protein
LFPSPDYYEVYKAAREFFERELTKAALAAFISEGMTERRKK